MVNFLKPSTWFSKREEKSYHSDVLSPRFLSDDGDKSASYGNYGQGIGSQVFADFDGDKFAGGFGATKIFTEDYWTLRARSNQLFKENLYAKGMIRRLITNEVNTGLSPEACPDEVVLGLPEDSLNDWTELTENRFRLWANNPLVCDWKEEMNFGGIQRTARREALIEGDVLVVMHMSKKTNMPQIELVSGSSVRNPLSNEGSAKKGNEIKHGVELDARGRQVAFWIRQKDGKSKRIPAFGERTGRKIAWLVYGTERKVGEVRGEPLLSIVLQSLKEIDRYRDSVQRKAVVNSIIALFIKKSSDKPSTLPMSGARAHGKSVDVPGDGVSSEPRKFNIAKYLPGVIMDELQEGEEPVMKGGEGTDVNFGEFEAAIIQAIAWANEMPPEILTLSFSSNYSASQAATNEFRIYLNMIWSYFGNSFCRPIYNEWLISEVLTGSIKANGFLEAWRDLSKYDIYGSWIDAEWYGQIKPSTDMFKQVRASELLVKGGYSTRAREARINSGMKHSKVVKRLKKENQDLAEANAPLLEIQEKIKNSGLNNSNASAIDDLEFEAMIDDYLGERELASA